MFSYEFKLLPKAFKLSFLSFIILHSNKQNINLFKILFLYLSFMANPAIASFVYKSFPAIAVFHMLSLKLSKTRC
ncbi:hypothetical protein BFG05_04025 [Campylobacter pinnipediorum subsp. pinnipediorum]|nr:hypothetical protein BFG05_04025 [Campylobacter pinnipediorum subsp. pinnipediorum]